MEKTPGKEEKFITLENFPERYFAHPKKPKKNLGVSYTHPGCTWWAQTPVISRVPKLHLFRGEIIRLRIYKAVYRGPITPFITIVGCPPCNTLEKITTLPTCI